MSFTAAGEGFKLYGYYPNASKGGTISNFQNLQISSIPAVAPHET